MDDEQVVTLLGFVPILVILGIGLFGVVCNNVSLIVFSIILLVLSSISLVLARKVLKLQKLEERK